MNEARRHAITASELLAGVERRSEQLARMTAQDKMQMIATGAVARENADAKWTVELATLTALALGQTEEVYDG